MLLDLSAAFDTVDHTILLQTLENLVGLCGTVLKWFKSYLHDFVSTGNCVSEQLAMTCGVPEGSILGSLLLNLYMLLLGQIIQNIKVAYHNYADGMQIYISLTPGDYRPVEFLALY